MSTPTDTEVFGFLGFSLDPRRRLLFGPDGRSAPLAGRAFDTLLYLVEHPNQLIEKHTLMKAVWPTAVVEENNLNQNISIVRRALGEIPGEHRFVVTVPGRGFRFVPQVTRGSAECGSTANPVVQSNEGPGGHVIGDSDRDERYGATDAVTEEILSRVSDDSDSVRIAAGRWRQLPWGLVTALLLVALASIASVLAYERGPRRSAAAPSEVLRMNVDLPRGVDLAATDGATLALSPDGTKLVMVGTHDGHTELYLRSIDQAATRLISGTDGARGPFFSPDGKQIGFWADGHLKTLFLAGGAPAVICAATTESGAAWLSDGTIVFSDGFRLRRVSGHGGNSQRITGPDSSQPAGRERWPVALPGGKAVLFEIDYNGNSAAERSVAVLSPSSRKWKVLVTGASQPRFVAPGFVVVNRVGTLEAAPFDVARLALTGPFVRLGEGASTPGAASVVSYDVAASGRKLVYVNGSSTSQERGLYSVDLHGKAELLSSDRKAYWYPAVSPDGGKLAVTVFIDKQVSEVWVLDLAHRTWLRLTSGHNDWQPAWKGDQTLLYYRGKPDGNGWDEDTLSVRGNATPRRLASSAHEGGSQALEPDRQMAVFTTVGPSGQDLWIQPFAPGATARPLITAPANQRVSTQGFSPDGRWLAYMSDATGREEIYVTDFPAGSDSYRVSRGGGTFPAWSSDGHQIFYWHGNTMMAVTVQSGATFATHGGPHALFVAPFTPFNQFDVAPDGKHFYVVGYDTKPTSPVVFVSDVTGDLRPPVKAR